MLVMCLTARSYIRCSCTWNSLCSGHGRDFASLTALRRCSQAPDPQDVCSTHSRRRTPKLAASPKLNAPSTLGRKPRARVAPSVPPVPREHQNTRRQPEINVLASLHTALGPRAPDQLCAIISGHQDRAFLALSSSLASRATAARQHLLPFEPRIKRHPLTASGGNARSTALVMHSNGSRTGLQWPRTLRGCTLSQIQPARCSAIPPPQLASRSWRSLRRLSSRTSGVCATVSGGGHEMNAGCRLRASDGAQYEQQFARECPQPSAAEAGRQGGHVSRCSTRAEGRQHTAFCRECGSDVPWHFRACARARTGRPPPPSPPRRAP